MADAQRERIEAAEHKICALIGRHVPLQVNARILVSSGDPALEIEHAAIIEGADLIVIATHGASGLRHLLFGSVTEKVMHQTHCSVLVVPAPRK